MLSIVAWATLPELRALIADPMPKTSVTFAPEAWPLIRFAPSGMEQYWHVLFLIIEMVKRSPPSFGMLAECFLVRAPASWAPPVYPQLQSSTVDK